MLKEKEARWMTIKEGTEESYKDDGGGDKKYDAPK